MNFANSIRKVECGHSTGKNKNIILLYVLSHYILILKLLIYMTLPTKKCIITQLTLEKVALTPTVPVTTIDALGHFETG